MTLPRITVITPSLNQDAYIERAICSVLDQGYSNLEYFIVDGGSSDSTREILGHYESHLSAIISEPDTGPAQAINKALALATGDIIAILHADDLFLPGALAAAARAMTAPNHAPWVVGHCLRIDEDDQMLGRWTSQAPSSLAAYLRHDSGVLPLVSSFFQRDLFRAHGQFSKSLRFAYDYEFFCRLLTAGVEPTILPQSFGARREHPQSASVNNTVRLGMELIAAAQSHADVLSLADRFLLWRNCDARKRIYTLAQAEMRNHDSRKFLWQRVLGRPWWLANDALRHALVHGPVHAAPAHALRRAA